MILVVFNHTFSEKCLCGTVMTIVYQNNDDLFVNMYRILTTQVFI